MTSINSASKFTAAFKKLLKRRWAGALIVIVLAIAAAIIVASTTVSGYSGVMYDYDEYGKAIASSSIAEEYYIDEELLTFGGGLCILIGIYDLFACSRYLKEIYKKRSCDYYFASPITRSEYFNSAFLFGAAVNLIAFCAAVAVYSVIITIPSIPNVVLKIEPAAYFSVFSMLLALLAAFALLLLCAVLSGKKLHYIFLSVIALISAPLAFTGIAANVNYIWGVIRKSIGLAALSPAGNAINAFISYSDNGKTPWPLVVISAVEIIAAYGIGLHVFKTRKAEVAEVSLTGKIVPFFFLAMLQASAFMYLGNLRKYGVSLGGGLILAVIVTLIYSAVFYKKAFTKETLITLGCTSLACIVFISAVYLPRHSSFVGYVPQAQEVESVELTIDNYTYSEDATNIYMLLFESASADYGEHYTITSEEGIEKALALHQKVVSQDVISKTRDNRSDYYGYYYNDFGFEIKYKLKSGKTVARQYSLSSALIMDEVTALFQSEELLRMIEPYSVSEEKILFVGAQLFKSVPESYEEDGYQYTDYSNSYYYADYYQPAAATEITANYSELKDIIIQDKLGERSDCYFDSNYFGFYPDVSNYGYRSAGSVMVYYYDEDTPSELVEKARAMSFDEFQAFISSDAYYDSEYGYGFRSYEIELFDEDALSLEYLRALGLEPTGINEAEEYYVD